VLKARKCGTLTHADHPLVNLPPFAAMNCNIKNVNPEATLGSPTLTAKDYTRVLPSQNINHPPIAAMNSNIENVNPKETSIGTTTPAMLNSHNINLPPIAAMDHTRVLDSQNINHPPFAAMNRDIENVNPEEISIGTTTPAMLDSQNINHPPFAAMDCNVVNVIPDATSVSTTMTAKEDESDPNSQNIQVVIKLIKKHSKNTEDLMHVPSTGSNGEDLGSLYQTPRPSHLCELLLKIWPYIVKIINDFSLENKPLRMLDAGAGMHFPGVGFAMLGGFHSIGLEINTTRCAMAAHFLESIVDEYPSTAVAFYNQDITVSGNWSKILIFYFWHKVRAHFSICLWYSFLRSHYPSPCVGLGI
jgi:hypothetical protein